MAAESAPPATPQPRTAPGEDATVQQAIIASLDNALAALAVQRRREATAPRDEPTTSSFVASDKA